MKDYYAILGISPSAEDVVIRAAWKALSQRYHPDKYAGDVAKATQRMAEINDAYNILSDPIQRRAYDKLRDNNEGDFGDWVHEEDAGQATNNFDPLEKDWALAVGFYPDLTNINNKLSKISKLLAFTYRASLLERKAFEHRSRLANDAEVSFLKSYFGNNQEIVDFARELILAGNKAAAKALNESIRVLGSDIPPNKVINKICKDFNFETEEMKETKEQIERRESVNAANKKSEDNTVLFAYLSVFVLIIVVLTASRFM
jgi:curved DNA-binding protein CbpA